LSGRIRNKQYKNAATGETGYRAGIFAVSFSVSIQPQRKVMSSTRTARIVRSLVLSTLALAIARADTILVPEGAISVTSNVSSLGPLFQYNYTVADGTGQLAVLDIVVTPGIAISGLTGPGGAADFATAYDPVLGLVSFLENGAVFTATPESGFIFDSSIAPSASNFGVTLFDGTTGSGNVQAPVIVPEPSALALCALGFAAVLFRRKARLLLALYKIPLPIHLEGARIHE
jgi:hypothetical protein